MNDDEQYALTPFGLLSIDIGEWHARRAVDAIELYLRRHYGAPSAIVWDGEQLVFSRLTDDAEARG